jgi:hypothetical protein
MPALFPEDVDEGDPELQEAALSTLVGITAEFADEVAGALRTITVTPDHPAVCLALLRANAASRSRSPLQRDCFRAALEMSQDARELGAKALAQWSEPSSEYLSIFLAAVAQHPSDLSVEQVAKVIRAMHEEVTPIDAIGKLGTHNGQRLAERVAVELGLKRHPVKELFAASRRVNDELFDRRVGYVEAWKQQSRKTDRLALEEYCAALQKAGSEHRLGVLVSSLLRFFPDADSVPARAQLRSAVFDALERLSPITSEQLKADLETARTQLGLETAGTSAKVSKLYHRVFRD